MEDGSKYSLPRCPIHHDYRLGFICSKPECELSQRLLCQMCAITTHAGHSSHFIIAQDVMALKKLHFTNWPRENLSKEISKMVENMESSENPTIMIQNLKGKIMDQFTALKQEIFEALDKKKDEMLFKFDEAVPTDFVKSIRKDFMKLYRLDEFANQLIGICRRYDFDQRTKSELDGFLNSLFNNKVDVMALQRHLSVSQVMNQFTSNDEFLKLRASLLESINNFSIKTARLEIVKWSNGEPIIAPPQLLPHEGKSGAITTYSFTSEYKIKRPFKVSLRLNKVTAIDTHYKQPKCNGLHSYNVFLGLHENYANGAPPKYGNFIKVNLCGQIFVKGSTQREDRVKRYLFERDTVQFILENDGTVRLKINNDDMGIVATNCQEEKYHIYASFDTPTCEVEITEVESYV